MNRIYTLDGNKFSSIEEFYDEIGDLLLPGEFWGKNLDALHDILSGSFNIPKAPFELVWLNANKSLNDFGAKATVQWYKQKLELQTENREYFFQAIEDLESGKSNTKTLFEVLVEILAENSNSYERKNDSILFKFQNT